MDGLHIVLVGSGALRPELKSSPLRRTYRSCALLGFVNQRQLPAIYAAADFLVLPSEYEPFGLVVNEAFAAGRTAIVSEACGSVGDLVEDGETGYVVPVGDVKTLSLRLRSLALDKESSDFGGKRSRVEGWSPAANADAFAGALSVLVKGDLT